MTPPPNNPLQDLIVYAESIETSLRAESAALMGKLRDTELDLEDATRSRRELQQQIQQLEVFREAVVQDNNYLKVHTATVWGQYHSACCSHSLQNSNPYVVVLIDGDCLLVSPSLPLTNTQC